MTLCTQPQVNYFVEVEGAQMKLYDTWQIVVDCWRTIPEHFCGTTLDEFIVMQIIYMES